MQVSDVNKINMISQVNPTHDQLDYNTSNSDGNTQPGTSRKRQNSEKDDIENKKLKVTEQLQIPVMGESEKFLFSAIQNLATNITVSFNMLSDRMIQMESSIEAKISAKIESALETKVKEEVGKFKKDIQQDFDRINEKIDNVQKSYDDLAKNKDNGTINSSRAANIVIKNLEYDAREKDDNQITVHKVQALFRDGMAIPDVKIKSASRKQGRENHNGIIIVELDDAAQKKTIFSQKRKLKNNTGYKKVYIDNDLPLETRIVQNNMRTIIKEMGKEQDMVFVGNRLVHKRH